MSVFMLPAENLPITTTPCGWCVLWTQLEPTQDIDVKGPTKAT